MRSDLPSVLGGRAGQRLTGMRRGIAAGSAALLVATGAMVAMGAQANAAPGCRVTYSENAWNTGFTTTINITNTGDAWTSWELKYSYTGTEQLGNGWSGSWSQSGRDITVRNAGWNGSVGTNQSVSIGAQFSFTGNRTTPAPVFSINGTTCNGVGPTSTTSITPTSPTITPTSPTVTPTGNPGARVNNPYEGARVYVNPDWQAKANAESGGSRVSNNPTFVWLDRRAAIAGTSLSRGLRAHLDTALAQGAGLFQVVIYNLPGRDCSALASNGELKPDELPIYKTEYIDPIAAILSDPKYAAMRIVTIIEIDSLPNLITNVSPRETATENCNLMKENGNYVKGVGYALAKLGAIPNVYNYVDAGHHGWLGWDTNLQPTIDLMKTAAQSEGSTTANVHGFIVNTANYGILTEPFFTINDTVNGTSVRQSKWIDWNWYVDELGFAKAWRDKAAASGFDSNIGMLIDTSRNGWGGSARPTGPGPQTSVDAYVDGGRLDRRIHLGNWCNQAGAGIGERPRSVNSGGIDAYVWVKPPGESDGSSKFIENDEGKGFDRMCDPTYEGNARNNYNMSGALGDAPLSGHWFSAQFQELMRNAYPPLG